MDASTVVFGLWLVDWIPKEKIKETAIEAKKLEKKEHENIKESNNFAIMKIGV